MSYAANTTSGSSTTNETKNENPGVVTSDSLAAESINDGGTFGAGSDSRGPMSQPSRSTNTNNTDTSGATRLAPAVDAEARQAQEDAPSESTQIDAAKQTSGSSGAGASVDSNAGGSGGETVRPSEGGEQSTSGSGESAGESAKAEPQRVYKPKGKHLHEGGFDDDAPNASFNTDIGSENDPGRLALGNMQASDVPVGGGPRQQGMQGDGRFNALADDANS